MYAKAIPLLETDIRLCTQAGEFHNAANSLLKLAEISLIQNNDAKAKQQLSQARAFTAITYDQYRLLENLFPLLSKLYRKGKMIFPLRYKYADSALQIKDSIAVQRIVVALARVQQKTDVEHQKLELEKLEHQKSIQTLQRNSFFCIAVLMLCVSLLLISRQRLLKKQKITAETQKRQAQQELIFARQQLNFFTVNIREKNELVERLTNEMDQLKSSFSQEAIDYRQQTLDQLRQSTIYHLKRIAQIGKEGPGTSVFHLHRLNKRAMMYGKVHRVGNKATFTGLVVEFCCFVCHGRIPDRNYRVQRHLLEMATAIRGFFHDTGSVITVSHYHHSLHRTLMQIRK